MALRGAAGRRYAQAVFDIAKDTNTLDQWLSDLKVLDGIFGGQNAVSALEDPRVTEPEQRRTITELVSKGVVSQISLNMLMLLLHRRRLNLLPRIVEAYQAMYNKEKGIIIADVTTAVPLDEAHQKRVADRLSTITGKSVELHVHEDPRMLGGIITRIGDELIDASLATRLAELGERMS
ncbi:MAG: F0F1 ATP synthase subunit delta [Chloroflexi bacterium]|nr:F0F1 ATP synthase subunit delta [Chloroflexota bacterium]